MSKFDRIRIDSKYFFFLIFLTSSTIYGKHSILPAFEIKTSVFLQNAWPFTFANQIKERLNICISLMWTLLSDWHIRFAEGCLWYLKYSLFWCLVGGVSITQCYFTQYLSITTLASTGLCMILLYLDYFFNIFFLDFSDEVIPKVSSAIHAKYNQKALRTVLVHKPLKLG